MNNPHYHKIPIVASLVWRLPSQLHTAQAEALQELGYSHQFLLFDEPIPPDVRTILIQGPYGSLLPLVQQLQGRPPDSRPILAYWFQQSLSLPQPAWMCGLLARLFSELHKASQEGPWKVAGLRNILSGFTKQKGARLGFLGDIIWLHNNGLLDVLALSSSVYAEYLKHYYDINSILVPRGFHPSYGSLLNRKRDIAAVWMGKLRTKRRRQAIYWLRNQLEKRGLTMHVYDGQENAFIYGETRTEILNRTWFVLNVFFSGSTDELSIRYFVAGSNGAVILSEPGANKYPLKPGIHFLERNIEEMPDTIMHYLENKEKWQTISDNMLDLKDKITLQQSVADILSRVESKIGN